MNEDYGRNLDLNLLRAFVVVAETGSVTAAAGKLYLTQPAISAALRRLTEAVGAALFARQGRGVTLTARGKQLLAQARPHLASLVEAALSPPDFDPKTSERTVRIGLSDVTEALLIPPMLRILDREAPHMRLIVLPVQFRTVAEALTSQRIDMAVTVADEMPTSIRRKALYHGSFVCLFDPRHTKVGKRITEEQYFAHDHVIVSYNGDLRGIVEDLLRKTRKVRCSLPSFANVGAIVDGTSLLATVPDDVATQARRAYPHLATAEKPFVLEGTPMELLWPSATDDDPAMRYVRETIERVSSQPSSPRSPSSGAPRVPRAARGAKRPKPSGRTRSSRRSSSRDRPREA
jgi:LysR family transcriptional regulator, mexEF-oprN operon transcriptional activator